MRVARRRPAPSGNPRVEEIASNRREIEDPQLRRCLEGDETLHILTPAGRRNGHDRRLVQHACCVPLPEGSFNRHAPGVLVATPELCLLTMACGLGVNRLALLADEFCGGFALTPDETAFVRREPLVTLADVTSFCEEVPGARGVNILRRAIRLAADGATSPLEALVRHWLHVPVEHGGYGTGQSAFNVAVDVGEGFGSGMPARRTRVIDICYPRQRCGVECDGLQHESSAQSDDDAHRQTQLSNVGHREERISWKQFSSYQRACEAGIAVRHMLGLRARPVDGRTEDCRRELWKDLVASPWAGVPLAVRPPDPSPGLGPAPPVA